MQSTLTKRAVQGTLKAVSRTVQPNLRYFLFAQSLVKKSLNNNVIVFLGSTSFFS